MASEGSRRAIIAALVANIGIAVAKFVGFLLTGAASLLAEALHSAADSGNQALLLLGGKKAKRRATAEHPFGYGRERYFWAFVVALVLFSLGGLFAIFEGIEKLRHPHELESVGIAIGILLVAIVLESYSLHTAVKEANHVRGDESWWSFIRHSKSPELPVVLLEDTGAEVGLFLALTGVLLAHFTDEPRWDAAGSLGIGILLVVIAGILAVEMKSLLLGESASPERRGEDPPGHRERARGPPAHPHADRAPRSRGAAGGRQARAGRRPELRRGGGRHQRHRGPHPGRRAVGPGDLPGAGRGAGPTASRPERDAGRGQPKKTSATSCSSAGSTVLSSPTASDSGTRTIRSARSATIEPKAPSCTASMAAMPKRVDSTRS